MLVSSPGWRPAVSTAGAVRCPNPAAPAQRSTCQGLLRHPGPGDADKLLVMPAPTVHYPPTELLLLQYRHRGPVFRGGPGFGQYTYLLGPEANEFVFAHDHLFRFREAFEALIPVDGPTSVIVSDGADHTRRRGLMRPALHHRAVNGYLEIMSGTADEALDPIRRGVEFDAYALFRSAIRRSTLRTLFGSRMASRAGEIGAQLQPAIDLIALLPDLVELHERWQTKRWRTAMAARAQLDEFVYAEIARARAGTTDADNHVLARLVDGRDGTGSGLTDQEVRDQTVTMIAAGYETTSAAMAWTLYALAGDPDLQNRARAEVAEVTGGEAPTATNLPELVLLEAIITEALRLYPPATMSARYVAEDFEFAGTPVRAGTTLIYSAYVTHRSRSVYSDPLTFRPERWISAPRSPVEFLPFGGGSHRCIGSTMAMAELTVMLARLLTRGPFTRTPSRVQATNYAALRPKGGLRLQFS